MKKFIGHGATTAIFWIILNMIDSVGTYQEGFTADYTHVIGVIVLVLMGFMSKAWYFD